MASRRTTSIPVLFRSWALQKGISEGSTGCRQKIYQLAKSRCNNRQQDNSGTYTQPAQMANRIGSLTGTVAGVAPIA
jgi:hypothetical protein